MTSAGMDSILQIIHVNHVIGIVWIVVKMNVTNAGQDIVYLWTIRHATYVNIHAINVQMVIKVIVCLVSLLINWMNMDNVLDVIILAKVVRLVIQTTVINVYILIHGLLITVVSALSVMISLARFVMRMIHLIAINA